MYNRRQWLFLVKLLSPFVAAFLICSIGLIALLYYNGGKLLKNQLEQRVLDEVNYLSYEFEEDGTIELLEEIEERLEKTNQSWRYLYAVQAANGAWAFDRLPTPPPPGWSEYENLSYAELTLVYTRELSDGYRLSVGIAEQDLKAYKKTFFTNAGWLILASCLVSFVLGSLLYQRFIIIVRQVAQPVQNFADGQFNARVPSLTADPELERLATNINSMFNQMERLINQLKKLSANIAHDLRTPLTRVKSHLAKLSDQATPEQAVHLQKAEQELEEVLRLFREILQLSEIQSGRLQTHFSNVNLSELIQNCMELYEPLLEDQQINVHCKIKPNVTLRGSPQLLKQVLVNLIENSLNHTAGSCDLNIVLVTHKERIQLSVCDTGKAAPSGKKHFGLGLGFVSAIVELHGGKVQFSKEQERGFDCQIQLPLLSNNRV